MLRLIWIKDQCGRLMSKMKLGNCDFLDLGDSVCGPFVKTFIVLVLSHLVFSITLKCEKVSKKYNFFLRL